MASLEQGEHPQLEAATAEEPLTLAPATSSAAVSSLLVSEQITQQQEPDNNEQQQQKSEVLVHLKPGPAPD